MNELVDISKMSASSRPDVETQLETLQAIQDYNKKLPKRRKKKDSLSECSVTNIVATSQINRKTKKKKKVIELETKYKPIGIVEGIAQTPFSQSQDKFSISSK